MPTKILDYFVNNWRDSGITNGDPVERLQIPD
jgi:hypothetical protein